MEGTYPGPTPEPHNQGQEEGLPAGQGREIGRGVECVVIPCTHFADEAAEERKKKADST